MKYSLSILNKILIKEQKTLKSFKLRDQNEILHPIHIKNAIVRVTDLENAIIRITDLKYKS